MKKPFLLARSLTAATLLAGLTACQAPKGPTANAELKPTSVAEANLTEDEAAARSSQIHDIHYALAISMTEKAEAFDGDESIDFTFQPATAGAETFLDLQSSAVIKSFSLNGVTVTTPQFANHRLLLPAGLLKTGANRVVLAYRETYSHDGRGLYRFVDPEDQREYFYTQFEAYNAHQMFACFDQPDLKATFEMKVVAPQQWQVVSTVRESTAVENEQTRVWTFPSTPKLSTYVFSLHAGPYHQWQAKAGTIPLRLFARESLARYVHPEMWFAPTRQGLHFYGGYFAYPYPFQKYDQVIVPDFNAGAMENVAAVTFTERLVHRGTETRVDHEYLASIILHEMAHMWFGDLVTMKWWNGLWLNESFATYMSTLALSQATPYKEAWLSFHGGSKAGAYYEDQLVTTHPIDGPIRDLFQAESSFDGITYGKGASVLKQLAFYLGAAKFRAGVQGYFKAHAYGNTTLDDFMGALSSASGRPLKDWGDTWLRKAGLDTLTPVWTCEKGHLSELTLRLMGPDGTTSPRVHRTQIALYESLSGNLRPRTVLSVEYKGPITKVTLPTSDEPCPVMVYGNDEDQDYVKAALDRTSLMKAETSLARIDSRLARTMIWSDLGEMVRDQNLAPARYIDLVLSNVPQEHELKVAENAISELWHMVYNLPQSTIAEKAARAQKVTLIENMLWARLQAAAVGSDERELMIGNYLDIFESKVAQDHVLDLLAHASAKDFDQDRRWTAVLALAQHGNPQAKALAQAETARDPSERGLQMTMAIDASVPDAKVKAKWLNQVVDERQMSFARKRAIFSRFLPPNQDDLRASLSDKYFALLPGLIRDRDETFVRLFTRTLLPATCTAESVSAIDRFLREQGAQLPPSPLKTLRIGRQEDARCVATRARFAGDLRQE